MSTNIYNSYIYIWYDTRAKLFYVGGHKGTVEDSYVCSNPMMLRAYKKRPESFKFRVLEYVNGSNDDLRKAEQKWLNLIKEEELYWTPNIYNKSDRYYNQKEISSGGNGKANKGRIPWNKGISWSIEIKNKISNSKKGKNGKKGHPGPKASKNKKWYHNPITNEESYFLLGNQPEGFILGRKKKYWSRLKK